MFSFLITVTAFCQNTAVYTISDFSKLLQSQVSPYLTPKNAATVARNVRSNDIYGSLAKRQAMRLYGTLCDSAITSLHRYYESDGTDTLLATCSSYIKKGDESGGTAVTLRDQLTSGLRWTWVTYKDKAIGCNGTDNCQKYDNHTVTTTNTDGARTASILTADLGAPFAELNTGSNLDASAWYQYKMQYTDGSTTWYSDAVSNPINTGSSVRDVTLTDIPLGPSGTTSRSIYRTEGQSSRSALSSATFKLVASIADNTTTTYNDAIADGSLTTNWSTSGKVSITPPKFKYITIHKERLFGANGPSANSYIYWSYAFKPDLFDVNDYDFVRIDDGDEITFLKPILGKLAIGKTNSITNFETQSNTDSEWRFYTYSFVGCPAPYSAVVSPLGIIYLSWDGVYVYNGEASELISDVVTSEVRDILVSNLNNAAGVYFQNEYQLAYTSEAGGGSDNDSVLVFDITRNSYAIDDKNINSYVIFDSGSDFGTLYSGSSLTDGKVLAHSTALSTLVLKLKSEFDAGTKDSITIDGTENEPTLSLGWGITINDSSLSGVTLDSVAYSSAIIDRPDTSGYWWSPAIQVNASNYDKLYWNEELGCCGNVTWAIRSAVSSSSVTADALSWSSEFGTPSGSDVSALTANEYLQLRLTESTTDITETPIVDRLNNFVVKLVYSRVGSSGETAINSLWESGYDDFGSPTMPKRLIFLNVYYSGTSGTMTVGYENDRGDIDQSFNIDLSISPTSSSTDQYFGTETNKVYKFLIPVNSTTNPTPVGRKFKFLISEGGITSWNVYRIDIGYAKEEYYED